jgi:anaerobic selenocysteine-containing dehydrogenase
MPSLVLSVFSTVVLSLILACAFLWLRCRRVGNPFGRRARWWSMTIIAGTVLVSAAVGLAIGAVSHHSHAAFVGIILPAALWLGRASFGRDGSHRGTITDSLTNGLMFPLRHLDDLMGEDMQDWCDERSRAVEGRPRWVAEAAQYYHKETAPRVKDYQAKRDLNYWRETIEHKITMARLADLYSPARLRAGLRSHPSTQNTRKYDPDDPGIAERLRSDAESDLHLFLLRLYRLGFYKLLIYPMRPPALPKRTRRVPSTPADA